MSAVLLPLTEIFEVPPPVIVPDVMAVVLLRFRVFPFKFSEPLVNEANPATETDCERVTPAAFAIVRLFTVAGRPFPEL
jgi:hypothetical protein